MRDLDDDQTPSARQAFTWRRYLRFWHAHVEADVGDELQFHFDLLVERYRAAGMSAAAATAAASARLGDLPSHTDACVTIATRRERRATRSLLLDAFWWDVRFAARTLLLHKTWTAVAVLTLALGIGATTAVFSVVNSLILNQLHYRDAGRLGLVWRHQDGSDFSMYPQYAIVAAWRAAHSIDGVEPYAITSAPLVTDADSVEIPVARIGTGFMRFAGIPPIAGRTFDTTETTAGGARVAILAERTWRTMFGASRDIVGRQIVLGGQRHTVIGVASDRLQLPAISQARTGVWLPLVAATEARSAAVIMRWRPGQDVQAVQRELDSIGARILPASIDGPRFHYMVQRLGDSIGVRDTIDLVAAAVALLLLIACANVAHLMLARSAARQRELAIRTAIGASRGRLARQLITESVLLSLIGGTLGVVLAVAGVRWLSAARPATLVQLERAQIDATVLAVAAFLTITVGIVFGLVAGIRAARTGAVVGLASMGPSGAAAPRDARARAALVVSEMALSSAMLVGAVLVVRSVVKLQHVDPGFDTTHLYAIAPTLPRNAYATDKAIAGVITQLVARARQLPSVAGVTVVGATPPDVGMMVSPLEIETPNGPQANNGSSFVPTMVVADNFFATAGIRFSEGGTFTPHATDRDEVIIDESLARRLWPSQPALGRRFRFASSDSKNPNSWSTVIGVANDIVVHGLSTVGKEGLIYYPNPGWARRIVVRTTDPDAVLRDLRGTAARIDATIMQLTLTNIGEDVSRTVARQRFSTMLLTGFAVLAVILAAIGLYGVLAYSVAERTREIGIRIALGATPAQIAATVARSGLLLAVFGLVLGLVGASWGTHLLRTALFAVGEHDPMSFATAALLLIVVSFIACAIPMRRAMSVDPVIAMRDGADRRW